MGFSASGISSQAGISEWRSGELAVCRDDAQRLLAGDGLFAQFVPALVKLALVFIGPFLGHVVRRMRRAGREVDEEGLFGGESLLLRDPGDGLVCHILHEVVAFFRRSLGVHRRRALIDRGIPLVRLTADEPVEILEAEAIRPQIKRAGLARHPIRHIVHLPEPGRIVTAVFEDSAHGPGTLGHQRIVAGIAGCELGDDSARNRMMVPSCDESCPGGRA